jgi:hypothetical protein
MDGYSDGLEKDGSAEVVDNTDGESEKTQAIAEEVGTEKEKPHDDDNAATAVLEHTTRKKSVVVDHDIGVTDAVLTFLVRTVLTSVRIAVILGWLLARILDLLASVIELGLSWIPYRDGGSAC